MKPLKKGLIYIGAIIVALLILSHNHLDVSLGDTLFQAIGISPWISNGHFRVHMPVLIGLIILIVGIVGAVRNYRPKYPKVWSRVLIFSIAFLLIYPFVTKSVMFALKYHSSGIHSIDYSKKESKCSLQFDGSDVQAICSFSLFNYGKADQVILKPIINGSSRVIELEEKEVSINPHREINVSTQFTGTIKHGTGRTSWTADEMGVEMEIDGTRKRIE